MAGFCGSCGAPVAGEGQFCGRCGARLAQPTPPAQSSAPPPNPPAPVQAAPPPSVPAQPLPAPPVAAPPAASGMSAGAKIAIAVVTVVVVGAGVAFAGVFYAAHKVSEKFHEAASSITGGPNSPSESASSGSSSSSSFSSSATTDVCHLLSKDDVGAAIGVPIVRAENSDGGCSYFAKGDQAEMTSKHLAAMGAAKGADAKTQQMAQTISGAFFKSLQDQDKDHRYDSSGTIAVLVFSVDDNAAETQMKLSSGVLGNLGPREDLQGIGDEAFVTGDSMLMFRKGNKLVRIMYMTCPCNTDAIKPLATKIAGAL